MAKSRIDKTFAILLGVIATPFIVFGVWKLHTQSEESAARAQAHSLLPAAAHVISEEAQSCGSDAGAAHRCVRIVFQLGGSVADQTATFNRLAEDRGWQQFSQFQTLGAYSLVFVKPPERIEVTLHDPSSPACHPPRSPSGPCANTLSSSPYGGYAPSP
ncbi:MAG TPA: hypothetical protein VFJ50_03245 [Gemmatimonadales bacterium]|nr:hypothetical protein [Gemmatimonadales bacterium]